MRLILRFAFCLTLAACANTRTQLAAPTALRVAGSTSMTAALRELGEAYTRQHPNVLVDVRGNGSAAGLAELAAGAADLAALSGPDAPAPPGLRIAPIGRDAVAVIVQPQNPLTRTTMLEIRSLYRGETLDWRALGGPEGEPVIVSREDGSGTRAAFEAAVMGGDRVTLNALVMPSSAALVDYVATHRLAVGYVSMAAVDHRVRALAVEGAAPTSADVSSGAYHLIRPLALALPAGATPAAEAFVAFALSPTGQAIIARHHVALR
jgi:phosphate transport system substrate-binding protein